MSTKMSVSHESSLQVAEPFTVKVVRSFAASILSFTLSVGEMKCSER
jgi:hypothetical protein